MEIENIPQFLLAAWALGSNRKSGDGICNGMFVDVLSCIRYVRRSIGTDMSLGARLIFDGVGNDAEMAANAPAAAVLQHLMRGVGRRAHSAGWWQLCTIEPRTCCSTAAPVRAALHNTVSPRSDITLA